MADRSGLLTVSVPHRAPARHRVAVQAGAVRRHDQRPRIQHRSRRHRPDRSTGHKPCEQATPEAVLVSIIQRDDADLSATEQIRQAQDWASGTGHLLTLWTAAVRQTLYPDIDQQIKARLTDSEVWRYDRKHARKVLQQQLRAAQLSGHDISAPRSLASPASRRVGCRSVSCLARRIRQAGSNSRGLPGNSRITDPEQAVALLPHRSSPNSKPCAWPPSAPWKYATKMTSSAV